MKHELEEEIKLIKNENYFTLACKLNNAKSKKDLEEIKNEIKNEKDKELFKIRLNKLDKIIELYNKNKHIFKLNVQSDIEFLFTMNENLKELDFALEILEDRVITYIEFYKLKEILKDQDHSKTRILEFKKKFNQSLPFISHSKYKEIIKTLNEQERTFYNYKVLDSYIEYFELIKKIEKNIIKRNPEEAKILFKNKILNKKIL